MHHPASNMNLLLRSGRRSHRHVATEQQRNKIVVVRQYIKRPGRAGRAQAVCVTFEIHLERSVDFHAHHRLAVLSLLAAARGIYDFAGAGILPFYHGVLPLVAGVWSVEYGVWGVLRGLNA